MNAPDGSSDRVAAWWSSSDDERFSPAVYWLANELVFQRFQRQAVAGRPYDHWLDACVAQYLGERCPVARMLSVGCGAGRLDRRLMRLHACRELDAVDLAPGMVERAVATAAEEGVGGISYRVADLEVDPLPAQHYDAALASSSLHHIHDLEGVLDKLAHALAPGGYLFVNEYVGPDRFALSARERELITACFHLLPERLRVSLERGDRGRPLDGPALPDPDEVARVDPSEAARSSELPRLIAERFEVVEHTAIGGTILQFLLHKIAGHFRAEDPESVAILELLFRVEDTLLESGELTSHFALVVARAR